IATFLHHVSLFRCIAGNCTTIRITQCAYEPLCPSQACRPIFHNTKDPSSFNPRIHTRLYIIGRRNIPAQYLGKPRCRYQRTCFLITKKKDAKSMGIPLDDEAIVAKLEQIIGQKIGERAEYNECGQLIRLDLSDLGLTFLPLELYQLTDLQ